MQILLENDEGVSNQLRVIGIGTLRRLVFLAQKWPLSSWCKTWSPSRRCNVFTPKTNMAGKSPFFFIQGGPKKQLQVGLVITPRKLIGVRWSEFIPVGHLFSDVYRGPIPRMRYIFNWCCSIVVFIVFRGVNFHQDVSPLDRHWNSEKSSTFTLRSKWMA